MSNKPIIIQLPKLEDSRGNLSFIESEEHIPFSIKRTYWIYDVPGGQKRSGHAYKTQHEFIIAISGSFDVVVHDGKTSAKYSLNRSYYGLYIPNMNWRSLENFSTNSLCLILSSGIYDETDYITNLKEFKKSCIK
ncbi:MAG: FdtA/QdtA family cupin domain-containing protein [Bacteroidota bacterium]